MSTERCLGSIVALAVAVAIGVSAAPASAAGPSGGALLTNGDFGLSQKSADLRKFKKDGWYESRKDGDGHRLVLLSKKAVAGNATPKAMIRASEKLNTYLTQRFSSPQTGDFTLTCDVLVRKILPPANHSAFIMIGDDSDKKGGPNSTGADRFVFAGFENAAEKGKINLFVREGNAGWDQKTIVAKGLDLDKWYRIEIVVHPSSATYAVAVKGIAPETAITSQPVTVKAFAPAGKAPKSLTAVSFASWNDGPGTFYVDNVTAKTK